VALGSLLRKAAVDAGFDLEPRADGEWWQFRSSAAPGVVWVHPLARPESGAFLALPLASQLAELDPALRDLQAQNIDVGSLPLGAAGTAFCRSADVMHEALHRVWMLRVSAPERIRAQWDAEVVAQLAARPQSAVPASTEMVAEVRRRVGQEVFRDELLDWWEGCCAVTGLADRELLRASHAKPWAVATDTERLDVYNGLLLAVHLDVLFDKGLLTFDDAGKGKLSSRLSDTAITLFRLSEVPIKLRRLNPAHLPYLAHHRTHVFRP
jgi:hypothetical protein